MPPREEPGSCLDCVLISRIPSRKALRRPTRSSRPGECKPKAGPVGWSRSQQLAHEGFWDKPAGKPSCAQGRTQDHSTGTFSIPASSLCSSSTCSSFSTTLLSALRRAQLVCSASSRYRDTVLCKGAKGQRALSVHPAQPPSPAVLWGLGRRVLLKASSLACF